MKHILFVMTISAVAGNMAFAAAADFTGRWIVMRDKEL
jgi:hypothetical protein